MPRSPAPEWRKRKEPITDEYVMASIQHAGGLGSHDPSTGHYGELIVSGLTSRDEATEYRRSLHRCALWLKRNRGYDIGMSTDRPQKMSDGTYRIVFRVTDKTLARQYVMERYGPDRTKWPYDPRRRNAS